MLTALVLGVLAVIALNWPSERVVLLPRESLSAAEMQQLPDAQLLARGLDRLRWYVTMDRSRARAWHRLPDPPRHVLVLSSVETDVGLVHQPSFPGLATLFSVGDLACSAEDLADAYRAIGAKACAAVADEAGKAAGDAERLADCDRRLVAASAQDKAITLLAAYIRQHADELAAVWARP